VAGIEGGTVDDPCWTVSYLGEARTEPVASGLTGPFGEPEFKAGGWSLVLLSFLRARNPLGPANKTRAAAKPAPSKMVAMSMAIVSLETAEENSSNDGSKLMNNFIMPSRPYPGTQQEGKIAFISSRP